jgi:hypothetical protein
MAMTFSDRVELDVNFLKRYFEYLFSMAGTVPLVPTSDESDAQFVRHNITAFIRSDMVCNVYSLVDFWLAELCSYHEKKANLSLNRDDIKGNGDLDTYHKYLTKVARLDLQSVLPSFGHLESLRNVRNCFIHSGGHVKGEKLRKIANIDGVSIEGSLVVISDDFIWNSLQHAQTYLVAVARA